MEIESHNETPHPVSEPVVRTIFVCHSMGGIVAADTLLSILDEPNVNGAGKKGFPYVQGILAFDTPYLGLAPGMFAHSTAAKINTANTAIAGVAGLAAGLFGGGTAAAAAKEPESKALVRVPRDERPNVSRSESSGSSGRSKRSSSTRDKDRKVRTKEREKPAPAAEVSPPPTPPSQNPAMERWGKLALFAGAVGALAAGGAAAYMKRDEITIGLGWVSSHFEFVRELYKADTLRKRLNRASTVPGVGFANLYTSLGRRSDSFNLKGGNEATTEFLSKERTFCSEPAYGSENERLFCKMTNPKAADEIAAHVGMFSPSTNPGYYAMSNKARDLIVEWAELMKKLAEKEREKMERREKRREKREGRRDS